MTPSRAEPPMVGRAFAVEVAARHASSVRAARLVARRSTDADDRRHLLEMLGLEDVPASPPPTAHRST